MYNFEDIPYSPFEPGKPVSFDKFKGRSDIIKRLTRNLPRVIHKGTPEHYFIIGKKGMGKTSFVKYMECIAEDDYGMVPIYINNEGTHTINELVQNLLEKLFNEFNKKSWGKKIIEGFLNRFDEVTVKCFGLKFKDRQDIVENVKENFGEFLTQICDDLEDTGIFIIIDDVNGLSDTPEFANWYKALFETLNLDEEYIPIAFSLVTYPDKFEKLKEHNSSFTRMFNIIEID